MDRAASGVIPDLFAANAASLRRLARGLLADEGEAEDVFQETWLELLRRPPRRDVSLPGWLRAVLRNFARKRRRTEDRRARREHAAARAEATAADPRALVERVEVSQRLVSLVLELGEPERSAILLRFFEDLKPADIARKQGIPVTTVRSRIHHALGLLRSRLERERPGTWKPLVFLLALQGFGAGALGAMTAASSGKIAGVACGASSSSTLNLTGAGLVTGAVLMTKKAVLVACLSAVVITGGVSVWCVTASSKGPGIGAERALEESEGYRSLLAELERTKKTLDAARGENASLIAAGKDLEARIASLEAPEPGEQAAQAAAEAAGESSPSGLHWGELSTLIAGNLDILEKLARNEQLDADEQSQYDLLAGELLKLSSKAKQLSKDPLMDRTIFRELVSALFENPLALSESQAEKLEHLVEGIFEGLPEESEGMSSLERYRIREEIASRLERGVEGLLDDAQKESWAGVRNFADMAFSYGGKLTLGTESNAKSFLVNWWGNALGTGADEGAFQAATPFAEAYLERAKTLLEKYATTSDGLKALPTETRAALDAELLDLQKRFHEEVSPQLGEELGAKLHDREPFVIRFDFGHGVWVMGKRRYF